MKGDEPLQVKVGVWPKGSAEAEGVYKEIVK
jgi:hypothetical protein